MSIFAALGVVAPAEAAVDYFLEVNGVPGESRDAKFAKSIDVFSYSWGASANSEKKGNRVNLQDLSVSKRVDVASPALFQRLVQGTTIPSVELIARKAGETQLVFLRYCLQDVRVSSIQQSGSTGGDDFSQENVSFAYATFSAAVHPAGRKGQRRTVGLRGLERDDRRSDRHLSGPLRPLGRVTHMVRAAQGGPR